MIDAIKAMLKGIDQTEIESPDGWWETSEGARFGAKKLQYIIGLLEQAEKQKPVACVQDLDEVKRKHFVYEKGMDWKDPLYTAPQRRTWFGLTRDEVSEIWTRIEREGDVMHEVQKFALAIENKLKEKNT